MWDMTSVGSAVYARVSVFFLHAVKCDRNNIKYIFRGLFGYAGSVTVYVVLLLLLSWFGRGAAVGH